MHRDWYWATGGGAGDVSYSYLHDRAPWRFATMVRDYGCRLRIYTQCHCSGVETVFSGNPYVSEVVNEEWRLPNHEDAVRFSSPIDDYWPIHNDRIFLQEVGSEVQFEEPKIYLLPTEKREIAALMGQRPLIIMQPFAGLSDRDGFDPPSVARLVGEITALDSRARIVVVGKNHSRGHKYSIECLPEALASHPNVVNLIDKIGLNVAFHLVANCDAFVGCHSNLIRTAWDFRRRNVCVMPDPLMTSHLPNLDPKYTYGLRYPESRTFTYPFAAGGERHFEMMDFKRLAAFLLGRE